MTFSITIYGDTDSGKSSLVDSFRNQHHNINYIPTIGVDYSVFYVHQHRIKIWDCSGNTYYQSAFAKYAAQSAFIIVTVNLNKPLNYTMIANIKKQLPDLGSTLTPIILVGTKGDLKRHITDDAFFDLKKTFGFHYAIITSAVTRTGLDELFATISNLILSKKQLKSLNNTPFAATKVSLGKNSLLLSVLTDLENALENSPITTAIVNEVRGYFNRVQHSNSTLDKQAMMEQFIDKCYQLIESDRTWGISNNRLTKIKYLLYLVGISLGLIVLVATSSFIIGSALGLLLASSLLLPPMLLGHYFATTFTCITLSIALSYIYNSVCNYETPIELAILNIADIGVSSDNNYTFFAPTLRDNLYLKNRLSKQDDSIECSIN